MRTFLIALTLCVGLQWELYGQGQQLKVYWRSPNTNDSLLVEAAVAEINTMLAEQGTSFGSLTLGGFRPAFPQLPPAASGQLYANLVENLLRMAPAGDRSLAPPIAKYTQDGLAFAGSMQLSVEQVLLGQASKAAWWARGDGFPEMRKWAADNWISSWNRLANYFGDSHEASASIESRFINDVPMENKPWPFSPERMDSLPTNFFWTSGSGPAAIDNPQLRADYEQALAVWRDREERKSAMAWMIRDYGVFGRSMEFWLNDLYKTDPLKRTELVGIIAARVANPELRAKLGGRLKLPKDAFPFPIESTAQGSRTNEPSKTGLSGNGNPPAFWLRPPPVAGVRAIVSHGANAPATPKLPGAETPAVKAAKSSNIVAIGAPPVGTEEPTSPSSHPPPYFPLAAAFATGAALWWFLTRSRTP